MEEEAPSASVSSPSTANKYYCHWASCPKRDAAFSSEDLCRHVDTDHVMASAEDLYLCQWEGCKMFNRPCLSYGWLERHVRTHTKEKPNKCFMNGCNKAFNSAESLQKHLNKHFRETKTLPKKKLKESHKVRQESSSLVLKPLPPPLRLKPPSAGSVKGAEEEEEEIRCCEVGVASPVESESSKISLPTTQARVLAVPPPVVHKQESFKVKILRKSLCPYSPYAKPPSLAVNGAHVHCDVINHSTMSGIRGVVHSLSRHQVHRHQQHHTGSSQLALSFTPQVIGERLCAEEEEKEVLVRWHPRVLPDEWIAISKLPDGKHVPFSELTNSQQLHLYNHFTFKKMQARRSKRKP